MEAESRFKSIMLNVGSQKESDPDICMKIYQYMVMSQDKLMINVPETIIFGWGIKHPVFIFTSTIGKLVVNHDFTLELLTNYFRICLGELGTLDKPNEFPLCVAKFEKGTCLIKTGTQGNVYWVTHTQQGKNIMFQRFIKPPGQYCNKFRVTWKPNEVVCSKFENRTPIFQPQAQEQKLWSHVRQSLNQFIDAQDSDNRLLCRRRSSIQIDQTPDQWLSRQMMAIHKILSKQQGENKILQEIEADFLVDKDNNYWFIKLVSYTTIKKRPNLNTTLNVNFKAKMMKPRLTQAKVSRPRSAMPRYVIEMRKSLQLPLNTILQQKQTKKKSKSKKRRSRSIKRAHKVQTSHSNYKHKSLRLIQMSALKSTVTSEKTSPASNINKYVPSSRSFSYCNLFEDIPKHNPFNLSNVPFKDRLRLIRDNIAQERHIVQTILHYMPNQSTLSTLYEKELNRGANEMSKLNSKMLNNKSQQKMQERDALLNDREEQDFSDSSEEDLQERRESFLLAHPIRD